MIYIPDLSFLKGTNLENIDYSVTVNGIECTAYACDVSSMPFNRFWPGYQRNKNQTEKAAFINFYSDDVVEIKVKYNGNMVSPIIRPSSKNISIKQDDECISFELTESGNYVFEPCGEHFALHIFFNKFKDKCNPKDATYYFGPGIHNPLLLNLKDNDIVYIHPEAVVFTSIYAENAKNIRIFGGGVLNNSCQERVDGGCHVKYPYGNIRIWDSSDICIEDVILVDSSNFVLSLYNCKNILIDNVKLVGHWRYNTDGIDLVNSCGAIIRNCFVRSFDDGIVIKAIGDCDICENILVENCVVWCGWGKTLELGLETAAKEYNNITFRNCDLIHNSTGAMAISNGHHANIHNISYENIGVEFQKTNRPQVMQNSDDDVYYWDGKPYMENLIKLTNWKMSVLYEKSNLSSIDEYGYTHDIKYKNIYVYCDYDIDKLNISIVSETPDTPIENIKIENIYLNGKKIEAFDDINFECRNARNIIYNTEVKDF